LLDYIVELELELELNGTLSLETMAASPKTKRAQPTQFCSCNDHGSLTVFVRARPWHETAFAQVLLPVALSYETFVCKLCVALDVDRALVKKVLKIPDILMRTTEDVIRLRPDDRLELVLHSSYWKYQAKKKLQAMRPALNFGLFCLLLAMVSAVTLHQKEILLQLATLRQRLDEGTFPRAECDGTAPMAASAPGGEAILEKHLKTFEALLLSRLNNLEERFEKLIMATDAKISQSQPAIYQIQELEDQFLQLKNVLRRKMKWKDDL